MTNPVKTHFTTRRGFVAGAGFGGVSLYGMWAAYGAAPGPMALLGLDHAEDAPHLPAEGAEAAMAKPTMEDAHGGHGAGAGAGPDPQEFSRQTAEFIERFRLPDGRVYPRRFETIGANTMDPHAGHNMGGSAMAMDAPASAPVAVNSADAHPMAIQVAAFTVGKDDPIDILMTAGKWFYLPNALRLDAGQRYRFRMMALDVGHGASIQFGRGGRMMRLPPGRVTETELRFARPGRYLVHCSVYCGEAHDVMQASIEVV